MEFVNQETDDNDESFEGLAIIKEQTGVRQYDGVFQTTATLPTMPTSLESSTMLTNIIVSNHQHQHRKHQKGTTLKWPWPILINAKFRGSWTTQPTNNKDRNEGTNDESDDDETKNSQMMASGKKPLTGKIATIDEGSEKDLFMTKTTSTQPKQKNNLIITVMARKITTISDLSLRQMPFNEFTTILPIGVSRSGTAIQRASSKFPTTYISKTSLSSLRSSSKRDIISTTNLLEKTSNSMERRQDIAVEGRNYSSDSSVENYTQSEYKNHLSVRVTLAEMLRIKEKNELSLKLGDIEVPKLLKSIKVVSSYGTPTTTPNLSIISVKVYVFLQFFAY